MLKKLKLGTTPKDFPSKVAIPMIDGSFEEVAVTFSYRTKAQFAEMIDENKREATTIEDAHNKDEAKEFSVVDMFSKQDKFQAANVLKFLKSWDLDDDLTKENLIQLENEHPGSLDAFTIKYRQAVAESRTKN